MIFGLVMAVAFVLVSYDVTALVSALYDVYSIINGTIEFLRSRWSNWDATWLVWSCDATDIDISIMGYRQHGQRYHYISYVEMIKMKSYMTFWPFETTANGIIIGQWNTSSMEPCNSLSQDNWNEVKNVFGHKTQLVLALLSHETDGIVNNNTAFIQSSQTKWGVSLLFSSCNTIPLASCDVDDIINASTGFLRSRQSKLCATELFFGHVTWLVPASAPQMLSLSS